MGILGRIRESLRTQGRQIRELHERVEVLDRLNHMLPAIERMNHLMTLDSPGAGPLATPNQERAQADAETMVAAVAEFQATIRTLTRRIDQLEAALEAQSPTAR